MADEHQKDGILNLLGNCIQEIHHHSYQQLAQEV